MSHSEPGQNSLYKLQACHITKVFFPGTINERKALDDVSLELLDGDFVTVIGSNGAGKSTMLNVLAGVYRPEAGSILIDGIDVTKMPEHKVSRHVGRVFQDPMAGTSPQLTIEENLAIAISRGKPRGLGRGVTAERRAQFIEELASLELGLENRLKAKVGFLSGGQRQALSLVMATFSKPSILLLDEHTAALDPGRAELITKLTQSEVARHKLTTVMVTHNMNQALRLGNRLIMMHEGKIILDLAGTAKQQATVEDLLYQFGNLGAQLSDRTLLS